MQNHVKSFEISESVDILIDFSEKIWENLAIELIGLYKK